MDEKKTHQENLINHYAHMMKYIAKENKELLEDAQEYAENITGMETDDIESDEDAMESEDFSDDDNDEE